MAPERDARSLPAGPGPGPGGGAERLPRAFLQSLRTLFDILDDRRRGCVHLREIECRWQGAEARELPPGVLEALRRAAPASGYLTFDCFVQGLRAALLSPDGRGPAQGQGRPPGRGRAPGDKGRGWGGAAGGASRSLEKIPGPPAPAPAARPDGERRGRSAGPREPEQSQGRGAGADAKPIGQSHSESNDAGVADARRHQRGRGEHRRHTITNGVDYSMLKQMKELEQEKDVLLQGLEVVERVREWYHQQIQMVQEHQKYLGKNKANNDFLPEGSQSHLGRLLPKLQEVIHCLSELLDTSGKPSAPTPG
ncbi:suppressor APC domain-containing protein 2 isoform X2 [Alligator mississippiensis]|uniref:suppressor APC domain-containing protein 2 isoform X2 n=1 Tax=Alligator mississippiensis TaxID=8496 RepID=UPI002877391A|nr:suppressor APC domain-containing protein 2 isoform X2 [Alligator mississippiensis]